MEQINIKDILQIEVDYTNQLLIMLQNEEDAIVADKLEFNHETGKATSFCYPKFEPIEKTETNYLARLNKYYSETYPTWDSVKESVLIAYTFESPLGQRRITEEELYKKFCEGQLGGLIRDINPVAFIIGFNEWNP